MLASDLLSVGLDSLCLVMSPNLQIFCSFRLKLRALYADLRTPLRVTGIRTVAVPFL